MRADSFYDILGADFYTGVPDSQLKALCDYLLERFGLDPKHHLIAANEGNAVGLAAGYHLATGRVPVVYMQNSGEGNAINPIASLLSDEVYGIPCIFVKGWRGEPGVHDEPQHIYQGKITCSLLELMDIDYLILGKDTTEEELKDGISSFRERINEGRSVAIVVRKGALEWQAKKEENAGSLPSREEIIEHIVRFTGDDPIVSTTGKASRELFEIRKDRHEKDFLTVGSMGHASSIALGIAIQKPDKRVWVIDGDGAALMHMGAMAVIGDVKPSNLIHIVINNGTHDTVGGQPHSMRDRNFAILSSGLGYTNSYRAEDIDKLDNILTEISDDMVDGPIFIEVMSATGARDDLGRPTTSAKENKEGFMGFLSGDRRKV